MNILPKKVLQNGPSMRIVLHITAFSAEIHLIDGATGKLSMLLKAIHNTTE